MFHIKMSTATAEYAQHLRARSLAVNSVKNAEQVLRRAQKEWGDILVSSINPRHVDRLFMGGRWAPATQNLYLQVLRKFFTWCRLHQYLPRDFDPTAAWANARVPRNEDRTRIPPEVFPELLAAAPHPRDRAIVALGLYTFARGSELGLLRIHDLDLGEGTVDLYRQKTLDHDTLPVCEELAEEMTRYLNWYRQDQGFLQGTWFLVPAKSPNLWVRNASTGRLEPSERLAPLRPTVREARPYRAVQRALRALGLPSHSEGVHTLRRSAARAYADQLRSDGYDGALLRVASFLGHQSTKVTEHYIGWGLERDQRNRLVKGKPMFPRIETGRVILLREGDNGRNSDAHL